MDLWIRVCAGDEVLRDERVGYPAKLWETDLAFAHEAEEIQGRRITVEFGTRE